MTRALLAAALLALAPGRAGAETCRTMNVYGYVRSAHSAYTADGTPITTTEPIAAAHPSIPFGTVVTVAGLGSYRVADRGRLGPDDLDLAVDSYAEAYSITRRAEVCRS